ncbi:MAG TPA: hypothetical protein VEB70_03910 [Noviherbaspirillum sp.]|nr:hypothetical protein [Noviherbaspirillum sp.]
MNITAEFRHDYAAALRNMHLNESEITRHTEGLTSTEGLPADLLAEAHFEKIISERNTRVGAKVRATARRLICGVGMIAPITAVLAGAILFIAL